MASCAGNLDGQKEDLMGCTTIAAVGLHLASFHSPAYDYNNLNPGVYIRSECNIVFGTYYNSQRRQTFYIGYAFEDADIPVFAIVALGTGYGYADEPARPISPIGMIGIRSPDMKSFRVRLGYIPRISDKISDSHVFHFMLEKRF